MKSTSFTNLRKTTLALAVVAAVCAGSAMAAGSASSSLVTLKHATVLARGDTVMGAVPEATRIPLVVELQIRDWDGVNRFIANIGKPGQPRIMSAAEWDAKHAPTQVQAQTVANYLTNMGYRNVVIAPNRLLVSADGSAATAQNAFMTSFAQVKTRDGRIAFVNTDDVRIPTLLQDKVLSVIGMQTAYQAHTFARMHPAVAHTDGLVGHHPTEFSPIYGGSGQAVASGIVVGILTEGNLTQTRADLASFAEDEGLAAVTTQTIYTNGNSGDIKDTDEWDLDSQDIVGMAGGAVSRLIFYNIPTLEDTDITADFNTIEAANVAKIINVSIGLCETDANGDGSAAADDEIFEGAVAQGQTFSVAAGDTGANECPTEGSAPTPSWPASSQYVIAAAGTNLTASTTTWSSETVWVDSGGSPSTFEPKPSWQDALVPGSKRGVPDVAFDGNPNSGAEIIFNGELAQGGGTSLSAPLFAGLWARVLQARGTGFGFAGPVVYALPAAAFHDITSGSNGAESAKVGYDFASGRGSMILSTVITDSAGLGKNPPVANFSFITNGLTGNFTDSSTDSGGSIASYAWSFGDGTTSTAADPSHFFPSAGTYSVKETVTNNVGTTDSKTELVAVSNSGGTQLLVNTGFETGVAKPWNMTTGDLQDNSTLAHSGNWFAEIGNGGTGAHTDHVTQAVTLPTGKTSAVLAFYLHTITAETTTTLKPDVLYVRVYSATGTLLATLGTYSNLDASSGYVQHNLNMTPYIGQTVQVDFVGVNSATLETTWDLDNVTLTEH